MYCRSCGTEQPKSIFCITCGMFILLESNYCDNCGAKTNDKQIICNKCNSSFDKRERRAKAIKELNDDIKGI